MTARKTKDEIAASAETLGEGLELHLSSYPLLILDGTTFTIPALKARLDAIARRRHEVDKKKADYEEALDEENAEAHDDTVLMGALVALVRATFGNSPSVLVDFGILPKKERTPPTVEEMATAVAKREATRKARDTMGPKAKLAIHGDVTGVTVTPITSNARAPAPAAATPVPRVESGSK
jgi:hypothetical protein